MICFIQRNEVNYYGERCVNNLTRLMIGAGLIFACSTVIAADQNSNYKGYKGELLQPVTIPTFMGGFEFTLAALYLQPTSDNLAYVSTTHFTSISNSTTDDFDVESIDPDYDFGFLLGIGYVIPNTAYDIQLNWLHFSDKDKDDAAYTKPSDGTLRVETVPTVPQLVGATLSTPGDSANAYGKVTHEFNAIDLHFGQYIDINPNLQTRLFAGLRYAEIERKLKGSYEAELSIGSLIDEVESTAYSDSRFNGIGPLLGVSANYVLGHGFGVAGGIDVALLVGEIDFDQTYDHYSGLVISQTVTDDSFDYEDMDVVTPAFDAKLGLNYRYVMQNSMEFKLELGYLVSKYVDVIETAELDISNPAETINFGLNGPYLSLNVIL